MIKRARALYRLQTVEADIDRKSQRLKVVNSRLGDDHVVQAARNAVNSAEKHLKEINAESRQLELESQGLQNEIKSSEDQLYSGRVTNPKELSSLEDKIHNLKQRQTKLEDELLENMLRSEEAEAKLEESQENLAQVETTWQSDQANLAEERDSLNSELASLGSERDKLRDSLSAEDLDIFEDLRRRKGGQGVVKIADGVCRGCGVSVPTNRAKAAYETNELVFCGSCERILYGER